MINSVKTFILFDSYFNQFVGAIKIRMNAQNLISGLNLYRGFEFHQTVKPHYLINAPA